MKHIIGYNGSLDLKNSLFAWSQKKDSICHKIIYVGSKPLLILNLNNQPETAL